MDIGIGIIQMCDVKHTIPQTWQTNNLTSPKFLGEVLGDFRIIANVFHE